jgi:hypothetical protein
MRHLTETEYILIKKYIKKWKREIHFIQFMVRRPFTPICTAYS